MTVTHAGAQPRLLVITSTYPRWKNDSTPAFVHELARRLIGHFRVTVLAPHAPGAAIEELLDGVQVVRYRYAPAFMETLVNDGGIMPNLRQKPWKWLLVPGFLAGLAWRTWRLVRMLRPDVIHAHWLLPQGLLAALLGRIDRRMPPFVVTAHGTDLFALRARPLQALKLFVARRAAAVTVVSAAMRDDLIRIGAAPERVGVQPMGVDLTGKFTPDPAVKRSPDEILFVGRLIEVKGLRHLIEAMPLVLSARPNSYLTIAGLGPEEEALRAQAGRLGLGDRVRFLGAIPQAQMPALYRRAAVFVAPFVQTASGDQEGLGLVSVEACGCGCPVIVSDVPAMRQVFPETEMVLRVPPGDSGRLGAAIIQVLGSVEASTSMCTGVRASIMSSFDWAVVVRRYAEVLRGSMVLP